MCCTPASRKLGVDSGREIVLEEVTNRDAEEVSDGLEVTFGGIVPGSAAELEEVWTGDSSDAALPDSCSHLFVGVLAACRVDHLEQVVQLVRQGHAIEERLLSSRDWAPSGC